MGLDVAGEGLGVEAAVPAGLLSDAERERLDGFPVWTAAPRFLETRGSNGGPVPVA